MREIIVDNFAGGGGASEGIRLAVGRDVDEAINHDPVALAMHRANHPGTRHWCEDVWDVNPRKVAAGRPVGLCWLSPDCKHFSKAKGGKPVEKHIRGLAWIAIKWAATVRPRIIILENVEEFKTWGPLLESGCPDPKRKGKTFNAFVNALKRQGYQVDFRELRACDYGAPTIRKRLFLVARCDGLPIVWPGPTHGDPESEAVKSGRLKPWRTAAEIIDWSLPCPSIFDRKKPLAKATMRRIARGIQKFVIDNPRPFIVKVNHGGEVRAFLIKYYGSGTGQQASEPLQTVTAKDRFGLVTVQGEDYQIVDIGMRMLTPRELFRAQGFSDGYIIDRGADGQKLSKAAQVARCGNAVPPPFAEALVRANLPEMCVNISAQAAVGQG